MDHESQWMTEESHQLVNEKKEKFPVSSALQNQPNYITKSQKQIKSCTVNTWMWYLLFVLVLVWTGYLYYHTWQLNEHQVITDKKIDLILENLIDSDYVEQIEESVVESGGRFKRSKSVLGDWKTEAKGKKKTKPEKLLSRLRDTRNTLRAATRSLENARRTMLNVSCKPASVHLGLSRNLWSYKHSIRFDTSYNVLQWEADRLRGDWNALDVFKYDNRTNDVVVQRNGRYVVYAQLTFSGRKGIDDIMTPSCAYNVELKHNRDPTNPSARFILMQGSTTQLNKGQAINTTAPYWPYPPRTSSLSTYYPHDAVYMSGVFALNAGERLAVEPGNTGTPCNIFTYPDQTFFGAYMLSQM